MLSRFSHVQLCVTPWAVDHQALRPMGFSRQEYWNVLPCPSPGHLPHPGIKPASLLSPALAGGFFTASTAWLGLILKEPVKQELVLGGHWDLVYCEE